MSGSPLWAWLGGTSTGFRAAAAVTVVTAAYLIHFELCAASVLPDFDAYFVNSDAHANIEWARGIAAQGWLNPHPYHPYNLWMREVAPFEDWLAWWGGEAVFQQSPLYAYALAVSLRVTPNLLNVHLAQCLAGALLCVLLAAIALTVFESRRVAWFTLGMAALYGPFYGYAWPLLRDLLGWLLLAASLLALAAWSKAWRTGGPPAPLSLAAGLLLGLGLLARETFYLIIPLGLIAAARQSRNRGDRKPTAWMACGLVLALAPLALRNAAVGAPILSTSNRFAENFIEGNARSATPAFFFIPPELGDILRRTGGKPVALVRETLATHDGAASWLRLQARKVVALFDPYEPPDNLSLYYLGEISPMVRFGLPHWLILIPGIGGLLLGLRRRDSRQAWLWLFLGCLAATLLATVVLSRYRQSLALLWIPWAAYFADAMREWWQSKAHGRFGAAAVLLLVGWGFCLYPHPWFRPRDAYLRPTEYGLAAAIHERLGRPEKARASVLLYEHRRRVGY